MTTAKSTADNLDRAIVAVLAARMDTLGWNVSRLARESGVPQQTVDQLMKPMRGMKMRQLAALAQGMGVRPGLVLDEALRTLEEEIFHAELSDLDRDDEAGSHRAG